MNADLTNIKHREITDKIIKMFYKVYGQLEYGFLEKVYENAVLIELSEEGIPAVPRAPIKVFYEKEVVGEYFADILVDKKVIVEIKAAKALASENEGSC